MRISAAALMAATVAVAAPGAAFAQDGVKIGVLLGFTGPLESLAAEMAPSVELAIREVSDSGALLGGQSVTAARGDSTCIDSALATSAAERLITAEDVDAIVGAMCSGATTAALQNVALPNGVVMVSPSATSPALTTVEDNGLFFRTAPSDARQGQIAAEILRDRGVGVVAITYTNNDYGSGLANSIQSSFTALGGKVTAVLPHEDGRGDYSAEVGALAAAGGEVLVVVGYIDQGGQGIMRAALDTGAFETFYLPDGMIGDVLNDVFGAEINGSFGSVPGSDSAGAAIFHGMAEAAGFNGNSPFSAESYDATALVLLAMQAAGSRDSADFASHVMTVANAPGEKIMPGELARALKIVADGGAVDYVGASAVELIGPGESAGNYREIEIKDGVVTTAGYH